MNCGSKFAYLQREDEDEEELVLDNNPNNFYQQQTTSTTNIQPQQQQQQQQQQQPQVQRQQPKGFFSSLFSSSSNINNNRVPNMAQQQQLPYGAAPQVTYNGGVAQPFKAKVKKATTNVLVVNLGTVAKESSIQTGDVNFCKKCKSGFSNINSFKEVTLSDGNKHPNVPTAGGYSQDTKIWKCEFCSEDNPIIIDQEEIPNTNVIDYILESEPIGDANNNNNNKTKEEKEINEKEKNEKDESFVIFCIDISGSMEVTQSVKGLSLPSSIVSNPSQENVGKALQSVNYVTRLQCVQLGLLHQIESIAEKYPNKRVGIVTFSDKVTLVGDGSKEPVVISGRDKLMDLPSLIEEGSSFSLSDPVSKTKSGLLEQVTKLRGTGSTALGSAVAASIGITGGARGSQIIICTDGQSNMGLGAVESVDKQAEVFQQLGNMAQSKGTSISVLTIKGTDTKLEFIGKLANNTGGEVNILDPLNLKDGFQEILSLPVLATNVSIKLFLHSGLYIAENGKRTENSNHERSIGNVNQDTTVSFEYGVKSVKLIDSSLKSIPFQLQIYYTTLTGKKCVRIITQTQEITSDAELAEDHANIEALGINLVQQSSKIASTGDYENSRAVNMNNAGLMQKIMHKKQQMQQSNHSGSSAPMEFESGNNYLQQAQDFETQVTRTIQKESSKPSSSGDKMKSRVNSRDDATANMIYNMSSMNSSKSKKSYI